MNEVKRVISLVIWGTAIACTLVILFQNLQPLVTIYFLGKFTIPIPLSLAILAAFIIGGLGAFVVNQISFWLSPIVDFNDEFEDEEETPPPKAKTSSPKPDPVDSRRYESDEYEYDDDKDDDVIDVKYIK